MSGKEKTLGTVLDRREVPKRVMVDRNSLEMNTFNGRNHEEMKESGENSKGRGPQRESRTLIEAVLQEDSYPG